MDRSTQPHEQLEVTTQDSAVGQFRQTENTSQNINFDYAKEQQFRSNQRLLRRPEVEGCTGQSRSTLYDWMKRGEFPQPVKLGARLVAWHDSNVTAWLESRQTRNVKEKPPAARARTEGFKSFYTLGKYPVHCLCAR